jgi:hypothetical protein
MKRRWLLPSIQSCTASVNEGEAVKWPAVLPFRVSKTVLLHLLIAAAAACLTLFFSCWWQRTYWVDLNPPLCSSRLLLAGKNPYSSCYTNYNGLPGASYPMTTILAFLPFAILPVPRLGAAAIWGGINGLLVYGLLKNGKPWLFLFFLSAPYWAAFTYHQISPLIAAVILLPSLLPLALLKPQIGLPVIVNNLTKWRLAAMILFIAVTFLVYPGWLGAWYRSAKNFDGVIPILVFPLNLLLLLALFRFRDPSIRILFLMACVPQRSLYDLTPLYMLPRTLRHMLVACLLSWAAFIPVLLADNYWGIPAHQVWLTMTFIYLPILAMLIFNSRSSSSFKAAAAGSVGE